ncbi:MAG TPA: cation diffusion facilitator family transporter [Steroidobacteraceae bacterium]|nr:cation diffusion facilitator family transporter [Steroidobacteraceae bacterium]
MSSREQQGRDHGRGDDDHGHDCGSDRAPPKDFSAAFAIGTALNLGIVAMQVVYGLIAHSTALLADAGHNLSDVLGLVVAWGAASLAKRPATARFTYGLRGSSIIAALLNSSFLLVVMGGIAWEAIQRFSAPAAVHGKIVMAVAAAAIVINGLSAWLFASGRKGDINVRAAFLHMLSDALVSFGVVCAGAAIVYTGDPWIDPAVTLAIVAIIVYGTWGLLRDSICMALAAVPGEIDPEAVRTYLNGLAPVRRIHDLHIWPMSTTETALTCHLVIPGGHPGDGFTMDLARELHRRFNIQHSTVQVEVTEDAECHLESAHP